jgi:hypothetical protein
MTFPQRSVAFVESPRLTLDLDHLGCTEGWKYLLEIFSARSPD